VRKLWIKAEQSPSYKFIIGDSVIPDIDKGIYSAVIEYLGYGDDAGYFILRTEQFKYVITDQIGDTMEFTTNIPQLTASQGDYIVDRSKKPTDTSTIFTNGTGLYCGIDTVPFGVGNIETCVHYGAILSKYNNPLQVQTYDRTGTMKTFPRYAFSFVGLGKTEPNASFNGAKFLLLQSEADAGTTVSDLEDAAEIAFNQKSYYYDFQPKYEFKGWWSDTLTGEYSPFGGTAGDRKVGYLQYQDEEFNRYVKGFDITESNGDWFVTYKENGAKYGRDNEPEDATAIFNNPEADPQSITLNFDGYVEYGVVKNIIDMGVDLI
jgi:hypothetical protein